MTIDDEGGGGQKGPFLDDVICERSLTNLIYDTLFSPSDLLKAYWKHDCCRVLYIKQIDTNIYRVFKETVCSNLFIRKMLLAWPIIPSVSLILK